jgi:hypothetical protein
LVVTRSPMLTPTDIHYLVGLLSMSAEPDGVEIELGSMVPDVASKEDRDVDITVTARNLDHTLAGVAGLEVKAHGRPLDSTHVEQLACKLNDMPSLTRRAIVSASGYSNPAVRKAQKHGIDLLELKNWDQRNQGFDHFKSEFVPSVIRGVEWVGKVNVHVNPSHRIPEEDRASVLANPVVWQTEDIRLPDTPDFMTFVRTMQQKAAGEIMKKWAPAVINASEVKPAKVVLQITDAPFIKVGDHRVILQELVFEGAVRWREESRETTYKVLHRYGETRPVAGCCVFEVPSWGLCGLMVSNTDRAIRFVHVPVAERNRKKIFRRTLLPPRDQLTPVA